MIDAGLVVKNAEIPLETATQVLFMKDLRELLKASGLTPEKSIAAACDVFVRNGKGNPEAAIKRLRAQIGNRDIYYMLKPPTGIAWHDFQSWRQQLRGIAAAATDIYTGDIKAELALYTNGYS